MCTHQNVSTWQVVDSGTTVYPFDRDGRHEHEFNRCDDCNVVWRTMTPAEQEVG